MESNNRKYWKGAAVIGLIFSILCLIICIIEFYTYHSINTFQQIIRISTSFVAINLFLFIFFNPLSIKTYILLFYIYGCFNLIDSNNLLGIICIYASLIFLNTLDLLKNHKKLIISFILIPPLCCLIFQFFHSNKLSFVHSLIHILGATIIFSLIYLILIPKIKSPYSIQYEKVLERNKFTERDIELLKRVLNGEKYNKIASVYNISESSIKAQLIKLYHQLGINSRTEFLTFYNGCTFILENSENATED